jgi:hypothetical protein
MTLKKLVKKSLKEKAEFYEDVVTVDYQTKDLSFYLEFKEGCFDDFYKNIGKIEKYLTKRKECFERFFESKKKSIKENVWVVVSQTDNTYFEVSLTY